MQHLSEHHRFLGRCHQRWVIWRVFERAGIGALVGAVIGFTVVPVLLWRGENATASASILLSLGAVMGASLGMTRRPTLLQTAIEADRQLKLNDLLSTSIASHQFAIDEGFAAIVAAQADQLCRQFSPNELIVRRLGGRAWGGIGIASALLLAISAMSVRPVATQAHDEASLHPRGFASISKNKPEKSAISEGVQQSQTNASDPARDPQSEETSSDNGRDDERQSSSSKTSRRSAQRASSGDDTGPTAGRTNDSTVPPVLDAASDSANPDLNLSQKLAGGSSGANSLKPRQSNRSSQQASSGRVESQAHLTPPWQSENWAADQSVAEKNVEIGKIPDSYRDVVRDYFSAK